MHTHRITQTYTHTHINTCTCCAPSLMCIHALTYTHAHTYTHVQTHRHTHIFCAHSNTAHSNILHVCRLLSPSWTWSKILASPPARLCRPTSSQKRLKTGQGKRPITTSAFVQTYVIPKTLKNRSRLATNHHQRVFTNTHHP